MGKLKISNTAKWILKLGITVLCLWFISRKIKWGATWSLIQMSDKWFLLIALVCFIASKIISSFRLNIYFQNIHINLSQSSNLKLYWLGMFYNLFLPGGIGGDAYKVILLNKQKNGSIKSLSAAVLLDRISGVIGLIGLASLASCFINSRDNYFLLFFLGTIACIVVYYFIMISTLKPVSQFLCFIQTVFLGIVVQFLQVVSAYFILRSIGIVHYYSEYILIFLLSSIAAILPVSIGGLGVREMVFLWGSTEFLLDKQQSVSVSLLFYMITVIVSFAGIRWIYKNPVSANA